MTSPPRVRITKQAPGLGRCCRTNDNHGSAGASPSQIRRHGYVEDSESVAPAKGGQGLTPPRSEGELELCYFAGGLAVELKKSHSVSVAFRVVVLGPIAASGAKDLLPGH
ncbi:MAG: hypothetical protein JWP89_5066 [Schlesneria sp.]|nr:hypothetical protein [Schlesneria sp.]